MRHSISPSPLCSSLRDVPGFNVNGVVSSVGLVLNGGAATVSEAVAQVSDLLDGLACKLGREFFERCTCLRETLGSCISEIHCQGILISETGVSYVQVASTHWQLNP